MSKIQLLILGVTDLSRDPRIDRQIRGLKEDFQVTTCGASPSNYPELQHISFQNCASSPFKKLLITFLVTLGFPLLAYWVQGKFKRTFQKLNSHEPFQIIIANDLEALPMAIALKASSGAKVHFDAHEWYEDQFQGSLRFRLKNKWAKALLKELLPKIDSMSTVSQGLVELYKNNYQVNPILIYNTPFMDTNLSTPSLSDGKIRMVHHGAANPNRGILEMIELVSNLDSRFSLDLVLMRGSESYFDKIVKACEGSPRIRIVEPWPLNEIVKNLRAYDVGLFLFEPTTVNLKHTIPNKFFEFIHAGLAVIAGPGGEMGSIIEKYKLGINVSKNSKDLALQISNITNENLQEWKSNSRKTALIFDGKKEIDRIKENLNS